MSSEFPTGRARSVYDIGDTDADTVDSSEESEVLADRAPDGVRRRTYDTAFEPAVAEGLLTVQAAWARGSREAYAVGLQRRYVLSNSLALDIADNRISLYEALEILDRRAKGDFSEFTATGRGLSWALLPTVAVIAGIFLLVGRYGGQLWENQSRIAQELEQRSFGSAARPPAASVWKGHARASAVRLEILRDESGRVTQVSAGRPIAVLEEICRLASSFEPCAWMEVRQTEPRSPGHRIGRFLAAHDEGGIWAVPIRLNRSSGRWVVGTGLQPLVPIPDAEPMSVAYAGGREETAARVRDRGSGSE